MNRAAAVRFGFEPGDIDFVIYIKPSGGGEDETAFADILIHSDEWMYWVRKSENDIPNRPGPDPEPDEIIAEELMEHVYKASCTYIPPRD